MACTRFLSLSVRRWVVLLMVTFAWQMFAWLFVPQLSCACAASVYRGQALAIALIPLGWTLLVLAIRKNLPELIIGWAGFIIAAAFVPLATA